MAAIVSTEMSCVSRGYHVCKTVWTAVLGEQLECRREVNNSVDRYAVGVYKLDGTLVGHLPQRLTTLVSLFLRRGGSTICRVTGSRQYSSDLNFLHLETDTWQRVWLAVIFAQNNFRRSKNYANFNFAHWTLRENYCMHEIFVFYGIRDMNMQTAAGRGDTWLLLLTDSMIELSET